MPFFKSMPEDAGPAKVFAKYPDLYRNWSVMSQEMMNGPSPLTPGERELILAYAAGVAGCEFVCGAHSEVAYAWGVEEGTVARLLADPQSAPVTPRLGALLAFVKKLMATPGAVDQSDADAVFAAGWDEDALHGAIAITARAAFMQRLVQGFGFTPLTHEVAVKHARKRVEAGYVNMYPAFATKTTGEA